MSSPENPLSRWSRRKREAAAANKQANALPDVPPPPPAAEGQALGAGPGAEPTEPSPKAESLPPIDSITADTDIRAFLAPGVPRELTQAALRRAWRADPKIRDFVGLADYDWDFNAQGAMAGFESLDLTKELRNRIVQAIGESAEPADCSPQQRIPPQPEASRRELAPDKSNTSIWGDDESALLARAQRADDPNQSCGAPTQCKNKNEYGASQHRSENAQSSPPAIRRKQGGALPK